MAIISIFFWPVLTGWEEICSEWFSLFYSAQQHEIDWVFHFVFVLFETTKGKVLALLPSGGRDTTPPSPQISSGMEERWVILQSLLCPVCVCAPALVALEWLGVG